MYLDDNNSFKFMSHVGIGAIPNDAGSSGFFRPWNCEVSGINSICNLLGLMQAKRVVETGTFEGLGTMYMALAMSKYTSDGKIATVDSGIPLTNHFTKEYADFSDPVQKERWNGWETVENARKERVDKDYGGCYVKYWEGFSTDMLPAMLDYLGYVDFFYQDSAHFRQLILDEFLLVEPFLHVGSVCMFDDIKDPNQRIPEWFESERGDTFIKLYVPEGHGQLWVEKIC